MYAAYVAGKDSRMKYFGGCDAGSTYTKCVIIDENGKIAEHWDIMEPIADKSAWQNQNGKF